MVNAHDLNDVLLDFCEHAATILEADGAGVSVVGNKGDLQFVTGTSERVIGLERTQEKAQAGPCVDAFNTREVVAIDEIAAVDRWPAYQTTAAQLGFRAVVGVPLALNGHRVGSLNVYDTRVRQWSNDDVEAALVLADMATAHLVRSGELAEAKALSQQLQGALDSRVVIEQAKGMVARDHNVTVAEAFDRLRNHSRTNNTPLRDLARTVVEEGAQLNGASSGAA